MAHPVPVELRTVTGDAVPRVDVGALVTGRGDTAAVARAIDTACRETGLLLDRQPRRRRAAARRASIATAREFFALDDAEKSRIAMAHGGRAWRGWFPVGGELTSGVPDRKEGIYFGAELAPDDPRRARRAPAPRSEPVPAAAGRAARRRARVPRRDAHAESGT